MSADTANTLGFDELIAAHQRRIGQLARKLRVTTSDVVNTAFLVFPDAQRTFQAGHVSGSKFSSYLFAAVEAQLQGEPRDALRYAHRVENVEDLEFADVTNTADRRLRRAERLGTPGLSFDECVTKAYAENAFDDAIRGHAVYSNSQFRIVIDGLLAGSPIAAIAETLGCTPHRVYEKVRQMENHIRFGDPIGDDRLAQAPPEEGLSVDPVRLRRLSSLDYLPAQRLDRARILAVCEKVARHGVLVPVVIDQFWRVLIGDYACHAAHRLGLQHIKTVVHALPEGSQASSREAFDRLKQEVDPDSLTPAYEMGLIPSLEKRVSNGTLSPIIAARLAHLPIRAQEALTGKLKALVALISVSDANRLVAAYFGSGLPSAHRGAAEFESLLEQLLVRLAGKCGLGVSSSEL